MHTNGIKKNDMLVSHNSIGGNGNSSGSGSRLEINSTIACRWMQAHEMKIQFLPKQSNIQQVRVAVRQPPKRAFVCGGEWECE